ncbi:MAG: hypothetical protein ACREX8_03580, partial [Gammaproteobacteria bacterium]
MLEIIFLGVFPGGAGGNRTPALLDANDIQGVHGGTPKYVNLLVSGLRCDHAVRQDSPKFVELVSLLVSRASSVDSRGPSTDLLT